MRTYFGCERSQYLSSFFLIGLTLFLAACGGLTTQNPQSSQLAQSQVLRFPNVGTGDIGVLDPALGPDQNSLQVVNMVYSGLVRSDKDLNVVPDQATWDVSTDNKTYTFHLKPGIMFSDGTPVTANDYVYTLTRALLPEVKSSIATFFEEPITGAGDVNSGKSKALSGVKAVDNQTLQISLAQPTAYFLQMMTNSLYFPLNKKLVDQYGQTDWAQHVAGAGAGTGPFMVKTWDHNKQIILVPNPHYYGQKPKLTEVDMSFVSDPATAFKSFQARQYDLVWKLNPSDLATAKSSPGFQNVPLLQSDLLFFDDKMAPFDKPEVRQAFAYAIDKNTLAHAIFKDAVSPAPTIIPPGMLGYQPDYKGLEFDRSKAKSLLQSAYPDTKKIPTITFSFPGSQVSSTEAAVLQQMWQTALGVQVKMVPVDLNAYNIETQKHEIQFGFTQWGADFPDPYDWLTLNLTSTASNNNGEWHNSQFDSLVAKAEQNSGSQRIALYNQAEQVAIQDVGWLPLDHQSLGAIIPPYVHGVTLNGNGLYFGTWSDVYLTEH